MAPFADSLRTAVLLVTAIFITGGSLSAVEPTEAVEAISAERRPYDVHLLVAFDPASFDPAAQEMTLRDIRQTTERGVGDLWSLKTTAVSWLGPVSEQGLKRVNRTELEKHHPEERTDIWFIATIETRTVGLRVSVRSWQPEVESETSVTSVEVMDQRDLAVATIRLCRDLVRPMGIVEHVDNKAVRIRLRAGELSSPDSSFAQLRSGDVLVPMLAYRNKDRVIEKMQTIPWTYITVDDVAGSTVLGTVQSGLRLALGGKKRGRIDTLVVALRPQHDATRLALLTQTKPPLPLVAHRLEVRTESIVPRPTEENPEIDPLSTLLEEKLTDRRGMNTIAVQPDNALVWLFAYSGQHLLAKVPFVPGASEMARLEVPDDATRLSAEADLQMLQGEVIDAVALRNTAIATIRAASKKDDWPTVNQKLTLLKQQQSAGTLLERLTAVRVAGVAAAKSSRDKAAEARINRMCDEAANLVNVHLGGEKVRILSEEMDALQNANEAE